MYTLFKAADKLGLISIASAPLNLGKLINGEENPNDHLLSILREQNISSVMVGMKNVSHVINNLTLFQTTP